MSPSRTAASYLELAALFEEYPDAMSVDEALGMMTALASTPTMQSPVRCIEMLVSETTFESESDANRFIGAIMVTFNATVDQLERRSHPGPPSNRDESVRLWCRGYFRIARDDPQWRTDAEGMRLLVRFAALADELDEANLEEAEDTLQELKREWREQLPELVQEVHDYWAHARREEAEELAMDSALHDSADGTYRRSEPKVGRNAPCPCGSGKKYKRCCGLN